MDHAGHPSGSGRRPQCLDACRRSRASSGPCDDCAFTERRQEIKKKNVLESSDRAGNVNLQFHSHSAPSSSELLQKIVIPIEHKKLQLGTGVAAAKTAASMRYAIPATAGG